MRLPSLEGACGACLAPLPRNGRFCSACGAAVEPNGQQSVSPIEALLSDANLHRVRKEWAESEARCLDIIRLDPNNVHAHSLLGDLYRDQGRIDHAAQWYELAVDLDPDNAADRAKLREADEELARGLVREAISSLPPHYPSGTQPFVGLPPSTWLKSLWAAFAIFVVVAIILVANARSRQANGGTATALRYGGQSFAAATNLAGSKGPGKFVLPAQRAATKASRTPLAPPIMNPDPNAQTVQPDSLPAATNAAPGTGAVQAGSADSTVAGFTVDSAQNRAAVVLVERAAPTDEPEALRQRTVQNAYRAASSLFGTNHSLDHLGVTVRVGANGPAAFSGEIERSAAERLSDVGDYSQILSLFTNVWWNPTLSPEASSGTGSASSPQGAGGDNPP
jgi:hypothetical protein